MRWFIDCGDDDFLYEGKSLVHIALRKREIPHEFRIRDGGHTWTYSRESLPVVLAFKRGTPGRPPRIRLSESWQVCAMGNRSLSNVHLATAMS